MLAAQVERYHALIKELEEMGVKLMVYCLKSEFSRCLSVKQLTIDQYGNPYFSIFL